MRTITLYWDVLRKRYYSAAGVLASSGEYPFLYYRESVLVNLQLVTDSSLTPLDSLGDSAETYSVALDDDWDHSDTVMCKTSDGGINLAGEWELDSTGLADPAQGQFSFVLSGNTTSFRDKIGTSRGKTNTVLELQVWSGGVLVFNTQLPFYTYNIVDDSSLAPGSIVEAVTGSSAITNGASSVTVSGLGLSAAITRAVVTVMKPASGGRTLFACPRVDSFSTDGFIADLSGLTDSADYELTYAVWTT